MSGPPDPSIEWPPIPLISKSCDVSKPIRGSPPVSGPVRSQEGTPHESGPLISLLLDLTEVGCIFDTVMGLGVHSWEGTGPLTGADPPTS